MNRILIFCAILMVVPLSLFAGAKTETETSLDPTVKLFILIENNQVQDVKDLLLQESLSLNSLSDQGETPLTLSAGLGFKDITLLLLNNLADGDARNSAGLTPLMAAIEGGHFETAETLLLWDADVTLTDDGGETALLKAVKKENSSLVQRILSIDNSLLGMDSMGNSPLHWAVMNEDTVTIDLLMDHNPSLTELNNQEDSPLSLAISSNNTELLTALLTGVDLLALELEQGSLLHYGIIQGNRDLCQFLVEQEKGLLYTMDKQGRSPLYLALERNKSFEHMLIAKYLIEQGSPEAEGSELYYIYDVVRRNRGNLDFGGGAIALHLAAQGNHLGALEFLLLDYGSFVDQLDEQGSSPLLYAVKRGYQEAVLMLIEAGASVHISDNNGLGVIHYSIGLNNSNEMGDILRDRGASFNRQDILGNTPLHRVILYDLGIDKMEYLLNRGADPSIRNIKGNTPLMEALYKENREMVQFLQERSDLFAVNQNGESPLTLALASSIEMMDWFFHDQNINLTDFQGNTVLHMAASYPQGELSTDKISLLLQKGAQLNRRNAQGKTPLHLAIESFYADTANLLVNRGSDMYLLDNQGFAPLFSAFERGGDLTRSFLGGEQSIIDLEDNQGDTPLFHAIRENYPFIATLLINLGADYDHKNLRGITPLLLSIEKGNLDLFYLLLEKGADISRGDNRGDGPLHYLVKSINDFNRPLAEALMEYGLDPNMQNIQSMTALHYSAIYRNGPALVFLVDNGADLEITDAKGFTALFYAVLENDLRAYDYLVNQGASIQTRDFQGNTLLHGAVIEAMDDDNKELIRNIIRHGGDMYGLNAQGDSPLSIAVNLGPIILDRLLFAQSINRQDNLGNSPLHRLLELSDNPEIWNIARERGADLTLRNGRGMTPYEWGKTLGYSDEELIDLLP